MFITWFPSTENDGRDVKLTDDDQLFEIDCLSLGMSHLTICQRKRQAGSRKRTKLSGNLALNCSDLLESFSRIFSRPCVALFGIHLINSHGLAAGEMPRRKVVFERKF
jgi:hypothetical protein